MRLAAIDIRDYRSIFLDDAGRPLHLELGDGMNTLVGLNNCGKSNVLRAVSLALDPHHPFDPEVDAPGPKPFSLPIITLWFVADGGRAEEQAVLDAAAAYEEGLGIGAEEALAASGQVALQVQFRPIAHGLDGSATGYERRELLLSATGKAPGRPEDEERLAAALARLREAVRFVLISSGESIESVLEGNFREILHSVVRERLGSAFADAERSRDEYVTGLQESLLAPLRDRLADDVGGLFPEIGGTYLAPEVPSIERTLSNVGVSLEDLVVTPLDQKGTGVRGGVLVAMLSYLALDATRSMVFAVEEPEAFLHPGSQEDLRDRLEVLGASTDVTLLVTTHSPYTVTRAQTGRIFFLAKDKKGRTRVADSATGDADHARLLGSLLRESSIAELLARSTSLPDGTEAVLLVEGMGDVACLRLAAHVVDRLDLLDGIHLHAVDGTQNLAVEAVVARAATDKPVFVLLDNDADGKAALELLCGSKLGFQKKSRVTTYAEFFPAEQRDFPYEAEDVFDPSLISLFVEQYGHDVIDGSQRRPDGAWHYDFNQSAKAELGTYLDGATAPEHVVRWIDVLLTIRRRLKLPVREDDSAEGIVADAPQPPDVSFTPSGAPDARVLILVEPTALARYQRSGALVLDVEDAMPDQVSHVGFYADGAIGTLVPAIVADYRGLLFGDSVAAQLRATGNAEDASAADFIDASLRAEDDLAGRTKRVLLLSAPDDPLRTLTLDEQVLNTTERDGRRLAWAVGPRVVRYEALARRPTTTTELDAIEADLSQSPEAPSSPTPHTRPEAAP